MELCVLAIYVAYATYFILYLKMDVAFSWTTESVYGTFILLFCYQYMKKGNWQKKENLNSFSLSSQENKHFIKYMRQANLFMMSAAMLLAACGGTKDAGKTDQVLIEKSDIKIEGKRMTPEALWAMGRIGGFAVSPDGKKIAYTVAYYSVPENKSNREVFVMNADGSENQQITHTPYQENEVTWIKGGTKLAFLSNDNGSSQLYEMNPDGSGRKQLTNYDGDIEGYSISPDGKNCCLFHK